MVKRDTVFILGAGASKPYGFPTGEELSHHIYSNLKVDKNTGATTRFYEQIIEASGKSRREINKFSDELYKANKMSVDAFLELRPEFLEIGKIAIARALIECEQDENLFKTVPGHDSWYKYFFSQLDTSFDKFEDNKIAFITFNYDRSLEHYLYNVLKASSGKSKEEVFSKLGNVKIIHLHGQLGNYLPPEFPDQKECRHYQNYIVGEQIIRAANGIKIISENIDKEPQFIKAYELLNSAEFIFFLGFGYNPINMERLNLKNLSLSQEKFLLGSTFGSTTAEINRVKHVFKSYIPTRLYTKNQVTTMAPFFRLELDESGQYDCLNFLRNTSDFNTIFL